MERSGGLRMERGDLVEKVREMRGWGQMAVIFACSFVSCDLGCESCWFVVGVQDIEVGLRRSSAYDGCIVDYACIKIA